VAKTRFINPLLQRTEEESAKPMAPAAVAPPMDTKPALAPAPPPSPDLAAAAGGPEASVKFTFYFAPEQLRRLDDLWLRAKLQHRARLNKSEFVRLALDRLMEEFDQDPKAVLEDLGRHRA